MASSLRPRWPNVADPKSLIGIGAIALDDIAAGTHELERIANKGLRGALIWGAPPTDKPYSLPEYDPFWAAAQDLEMPLSLHSGTGRGGFGFNFDPRSVLNLYMRVPHEIQLTFADLIVGGVLERFPRLKLVSAENDVSWIPHFMYRLDHAYERLHNIAGLMLHSTEPIREASVRYLSARADQLYTGDPWSWQSIVVVGLSAYRLFLAQRS
jgi:uncharacterized protein